MPTTTISDAIVFPQDPGTSPADAIGYATDPPSGGSWALHAAYQSGAGAYVLNGDDGALGFTVDSANDELTIAPGACYILQSGSGVSVQSQTGKNYDVDLPGIVDIVYAVIIPTSVTVALDADADNTVYLSVDPDTRNSATAHTGTGLAAPSNPSIELGAVDSAAGTTVSRANDRPDAAIDSADANAYTVGSDSALLSVATSGSVALTDGTATVDTGLSATDATFYLALGVDDPDADVKISGRLFWDDSVGTYHVELVETETSVGTPTVNYDVLRVR